MVVISIIQLVLYLLVIPACIGISITRHFDKQFNTLGNILVSGFLSELAIFQVFFIVFYFLHLTFIPLTITFSIVIFVIAVLSLIWSYKYFKKITYPVIDFSFLTFIIVTIFMLVMRNLQGVNDGDDAFVLGNAIVTLQSNLFYVRDYYTGYNINSFSRHLIASSPIYIAYLAKVTFIHPTILAHRVLGCFYIILHNMIIYNIGYMLFNDRKRSGYRGLFASLVAFIAMWDFHSMLNDSTFMLTRTWQGKAMFVELAIPMAFLIYLMIGNERTIKKAYIILLGILSTAAVAMTPGAIYMLSILIVVLTFFVIIVRKKPAYVLLLASLIPMLGFGLLYILKCR